MIVGFTSTYVDCHGHDCMTVGFTSAYDSCHGHDCVMVDLLLHMIAVMVMIV